MAAENVIYPFIPASAWWKLRKKFNGTIPKEITASYIATALDMNEVSAKANIIPKLKFIGFTDENNKPTEIAIQWRDDERYPEICKQLIKKLYPSELIDAIDDPLQNKNRVIKWFQNKARVGEGAANKMAGFYLLLFEADPSKQSEATAIKTEKKPKSVADKKPVMSKENSEVALPIKNKQVEDTYSSSLFKPTIHLDIQIHISPDSSVDQIDKIFESMAKHLTGFKLK